MSLVTETRDETIKRLYKVLVNARDNCEDEEDFRQALLSLSRKCINKAKEIEKRLSNAEMADMNVVINKVVNEYIEKKGLTYKNPSKGPFKYNGNIYLFLSDIIDYIKENKIKLPIRCESRTKKSIGQALRNAGAYQHTMGFSNGSESTTRSTYNVSNLITYD